MAKILKYVLLIWIICSITPVFCDEAQKMKLSQHQIDSHSKYNQKMKDIADFYFKDISRRNYSQECKLDIDLNWSTEIQGTITNTPVIQYLSHSSKPTIFITTRKKTLEAIEYDGSKRNGYPISISHTLFYSRPIVYDFMTNDHEYILTMDIEGNANIFNEDHLVDKFRLPRLKLMRYWYKDFDTANTDVVYQIHQTIYHNTTAPRYQPFSFNMSSLLSKTFSNDTGQTSLSDWKKIINKMFKINYDHLNSVPNGFDFGLFEDFRRMEIHSDAVSDDYVLVDGTVLESPVMADLLQDHRPVILVPVTWQYLHSDMYLKDINISNYIVSGLCAYDITTSKWIWESHLDITIFNAEVVAYMNSPITTCDINGDGKLEIIFGTSVGALYVLDYEGKIMKGFPVTMSRIEHQIHCHDADRDGVLDLIGVDVKGNIAVYKNTGEELWYRRLSGNPTKKYLVADINGDGLDEIVISTDSGYMYIINPANGKDLANYPLKITSKFIAPPSLIKLGGVYDQYYSVIQPSTNGYIYIIHGYTGCVSVLDIGEMIITEVIVEDITKDGYIDLLVSTVNGNVLCYGTSIPFHPLITHHPHHTNHHTGVVLYPIDRKYPIEAIGRSISVNFEIVDTREGTPGREYRVHITVGTHHLLHNRTYLSPGKYSALITYDHPDTLNIIVTMTTEEGLSYQDNIVISFNVNFAKTLKWLLIVPFMMMLVIFLITGPIESELPK